MWRKAPDTIESLQKHRTRSIRLNISTKTFHLFNEIEWTCHLFKRGLGARLRRSTGNSIIMIGSSLAFVVWLFPKGRMTDFALTGLNSARNRLFQNFCHSFSYKNNSECSRATSDRHPASDHLLHYLCSLFKDVVASVPPPSSAWNYGLKKSNRSWGAI